MKTLRILAMLLLSISFGNVRATPPAPPVHDSLHSKVFHFFSAERSKSNLNITTKLWGIEKAFKLVDFYYDAYEKGTYIGSFSKTIEDAVAIGGLAFEFGGYSCPVCLGVGAIYNSYYLTPGFFYRAVNFLYNAIDGKKAALDMSEFALPARKGIDPQYYGYLKCDFYNSDEEIKNNHHALVSTFVKKTDLPESVRSDFAFARPLADNDHYVVVPGRWLRLGAKSEGFSQAAFGTMKNIGELLGACAFAAEKNGIIEAPNLKPVIMVENSSWVGAYPVFFYVAAHEIDEGTGHARTVAAKLIPEIKQMDNGCHCDCSKIQQKGS